MATTEVQPHVSTDAEDVGNGAEDALQPQVSLPSSIKPEVSEASDLGEATKSRGGAPPAAAAAATAAPPAAKEEEEEAAAKEEEEPLVPAAKAKAAKDKKKKEEKVEEEQAQAEPEGGAQEEEEEQQHSKQVPEHPSATRSGAAAASKLGVSKGMAAPINPTAEVIRSSDPLEEVRSSPVRVTDLSKQLTEQLASGVPAEGGRESTSSLNSRSASGVALTQHDLVNTANVALVLQAGEFKLRPGIDVVPYDQLKELRLEDGLDVSRKEEYLSDAEFETVFGMDKEEFKNMPAWKRINAKKSKGLF